MKSIEISVSVLVNPKIRQTILKSPILGEPNSDQWRRISLKFTRWQSLCLPNLNVVGQFKSRTKRWNIAHQLMLLITLSCSSWRQASNVQVDRKWAPICRSLAHKPMLVSRVVPASRWPFGGRSNNCAFIRNRLSLPSEVRIVESPPSWLMLQPMRGNQRGLG